MSMPNVHGFLVGKGWYSDDDDDGGEVSWSVCSARSPVGEDPKMLLLVSTSVPARDDPRKATGTGGGRGGENACAPLPLP